MVVQCGVGLVAVVWVTELRLEEKSGHCVSCMSSGFSLLDTARVRIR